MPDLSLLDLSARPTRTPAAGRYPAGMAGAEGFRLVRRVLGWQLAPAAALRLVRGDVHPVALCGGWADGSDVIASEPVAVRSAPGSPDEVFAAPYPAGAGDPAGVGNLAGDEARFCGGWIGYLGYSAAGEALPPTRTAGAACLVGRVLRSRPAPRPGDGGVVLRGPVDAAAGRRPRAALRRTGPARGLAVRHRAVRHQAGPDRGTRLRVRHVPRLPGAAGHQEAVRKAVEYIHQGDIFQANITLRAEAEFAGDPLDAFCEGVTKLDPPYAAFVGVSAPGEGHAAVASLSPELFLRRTGNTVTSKPIKGTAQRAADEAEATAQRAELEASAKNRAENVMIVDLVRNDLSRVCVPGSVTVPVLLGPESHPGVWHLVSTVTGTLRPGAGDGDLIRAAFPPGSVTGAPKVRAGMRSSTSSRPAPRGLHRRDRLSLPVVAGLELNVAIRTFEFAPGKGVLPARGGGIAPTPTPPPSSPSALIKVTPLLTAVGAG